MRFITAAFLLLTLGGCLLYPWEEDLGADVEFSASQSTIRVGETVTLTLEESLKDFDLVGQPDGLIYSDQASSGPFDPEEDFEPLDPGAMDSEDVLQREPTRLEDGSYVATFELVGKRPGQILIRGAFVFGEGSFHPILYGDHGKVTITVTE